MEKYKKKLQEGADLRQSVKVNQQAAPYTILVCIERACFTRLWKDKMRTLWTRMRL